MKVLLIPEDQTLDQYILKPVMEALLLAAGAIIDLVHKQLSRVPVREELHEQQQA